MPKGISNMYNIERTRMPFSRGDDTNTTQIMATSNHAQVSSFEFNEIDDLAFVQVVADSVVDLDQGVRVADRSSIVRYEIGDTFGSNGYFLHTEQFV